MKTTKSSTARQLADQSINRLEHGIALARIAVRGAEPEEAVGYLRTAITVAGRRLTPPTPPKPQAAALRRLFRKIDRKPTQEARAALRTALAAQNRGDGLPCLEGAISSLTMARGSVVGTDPEAALMYLINACGRLDGLFESINGLVAELDQVQTRRTA